MIRYRNTEIQQSQISFTPSLMGLKTEERQKLQKNFFLSRFLNLYSLLKIAWNQINYINVHSESTPQNILNFLLVK